MTGPKPPAVRTELTPADVHRFTTPPFWQSPQGTPLPSLRQAAAVALMAFPGPGATTPANRIHRRRGNRGGATR